MTRSFLTRSLSLMKIPEKCLVRISFWHLKMLLFLKRLFIVEADYAGMTSRHRLKISRIKSLGVIRYGSAAGLNGKDRKAYCADVQDRNIPVRIVTFTCPYEILQCSSYVYNNRRRSRASTVCRTSPVSKKKNNKRLAKVLSPCSNKTRDRKIASGFPLKARRRKSTQHEPPLIIGFLFSQPPLFSAAEQPLLVVATRTSLSRFSSTILKSFATWNHLPRIRLLFGLLLLFLNE